MTQCVRCAAEITQPLCLTCARSSAGERPSGAARVGYLVLVVCVVLVFGFATLGVWPG